MEMSINTTSAEASQGLLREVMISRLVIFVVSLFMEMPLNASSAEASRTSKGGNEVNVFNFADPLLMFSNFMFFILQNVF